MSKPKKNSKKKLTYRGNKLVLAILVLVSVAIGLKFAPTYFTDQKASEIPLPPQEEKKGIPEGWNEVSPNDRQVTLKLEKTSKNDTKPTVTVILSTMKVKEKPEVYINRLIKGAISALPSLTIQENTLQTEKDGTYARIISGSYHNGGKRVNIRQLIAIKDDQVLTITASTSPEEMESTVKEVFNIFVILQQKYLP